MLEGKEVRGKCVKCVKCEKCVKCVKYGGVRGTASGLREDVLREKR
jgi:hypothetical protein